MGNLRFRPRSSMLWSMTNLFDNIKGIDPAEFERVIKDLNADRRLGFAQRGATPAVQKAKIRLEAAEAAQISDDEYAEQLRLLSRKREEARRYREAEEVAQAFHETYERLESGENAMPWSKETDDIKRLMIETVLSLLENRVICTG